MLLKLCSKRITFIRRSIPRVDLLNWSMIVNYIIADRQTHLRYLLQTYAQYSQSTSLERLRLMSLIYSLGAFRLGIPSVACRMVNEQVYTMDRWRTVANGTGGRNILPDVPISRVEFNFTLRCS